MHWVVPLHGCFPGCLAWTSQWFSERWLPDNFNVVPQVAKLVDLPRWARVYLKRVQLITLFRLDSAVNKQTKLGGWSHCTDEVFDLNQHLLSHISWIGHVLVASTKPCSQCEPKRRIWTWPSPNVERREGVQQSKKHQFLWSHPKFWSLSARKQFFQKLFTGFHVCFCEVAWLNRLRLSAHGPCWGLVELYDDHLSCDTADFHPWLVMPCASVVFITFFP